MNTFATNFFLLSSKRSSNPFCQKMGGEGEGVRGQVPRRLTTPVSMDRRSASTWSNVGVRDDTTTLESQCFIAWERETITLES